MTAQELANLLPTLATAGVSFFRFEEPGTVEIRFHTPAHALNVATPSELPKNNPQGVDKSPRAEAAPPTGAAIPPREVEIPHHVNEVQQLLRLSDTDLVNKLFPDYSELPAAAPAEVAHAED